MKRAIFLSCLLGLGGLFVLSCSSGELADEALEGVGSVSQELPKCSGGKIGDSNYCTATCKCDLGEGDCDGVTHCNVDPTLGQLSCSGKGEYFCGPQSNTCAPAHCNNKRLDAALGEVVIDCGGNCGTCCPGVCDNLPPNGNPGHCTDACPCSTGHGDCSATDSRCLSMPDHVCLVNAGESFGMSASVDVCVPATCQNEMQDGDETGVDCGPSCLPCSGGTTTSFAKGGAGADHGLDVALDSTGAIVIGGRFGSTINLGGSNLVATGGSDIFVAKYNNAGAHAWSKRLGGTAADGDLGVSVAVDNARNVYVGGNYRGTIDFGGGFTHTTVGNTDAFVVKFNQSGTPLWSRSYGSTQATRVNGLAVSSAGDVFVAGSFASASVDFGGGALNNQGTPPTYDAFVLRLSAAGTHIYSKAYGSTGNDHAEAIAIDTGLNAYIGGSFVGTVEGMVSAGSSDAYAMKVAPANGATLFAHNVGAGSADNGFAVAADGAGAVFGGQFKGTVDFGDAMPVQALGTNAAFLVAYDGAGAFRYKKVFTSTGTQRVLGMAGTAAGVAAVGDFQGSPDFGSGAVAASGLRDMFIVRYDNAGALVYAQTYAASVTTTAYGAGVGNGFLGVTGDFQGTIDFGTGPLTGGGDDEMFFTRLAF
jgi:hypothetical protein